MENRNGNKKKSKKSSAFDTGMILLSIVLFATGVVMLVREYVLMPDADYVAPPTAVETAAPFEPSAAPDAEPAKTPELTPEPTPEPTPYVRKTPVQLYFVEKKQSCPIEAVGVDKNGAMETVDSHDIAAWLSTDDYASPGGPGNAVIAGHRTWKKVAGVFQVLWNMDIGEEIVIGYEDGTFESFYVHSSDVFPLDNAPDTVMSPDCGDTRLTLITCYGEFDRSLGTSPERAVVVCKPEKPDAGDSNE